MSNFSFSLPEGEEMIFGVTDASSSRDASASGAQDATHESSKRRIGITNRRVLIDEETPDRTIMAPNDEVVGVVLKKSEFMGKTQLSLVSMSMKNGDHVEVGLGFLKAEDEARLQQLFPNARFNVS